MRNSAEEIAVLAECDRISDNERISFDMKDRVFSGAVLIAFILAIVLFNNSFPIVLNISIALIASVAVYELIKAIGLGNRRLVVVPSMAAAAAVQFFHFENANLLIYSLYAAIIFCVLLKCHSEISFKDISVAMCMTIIIPLALQCIVTVRSLSAEHGVFYALVAVFSAWVPDCGAFFAGKFFGKRKLCPQISPKKTVEGFIGGIISSVAVLVIAGVVYSNLIYSGDNGVSVLSMLLIGFFSAFVSALGDLTFSLVKRSYGIKDFGNVLPGHGGILDRFDSIIFTAPFVYLTASMLPMIF